MFRCDWLWVLFPPAIPLDFCREKTRAQELFAARETTCKLPGTFKPVLSLVPIKPGFQYTANATTTTQKQSDYKVEQSSFTLIVLF